MPPRSAKLLAGLLVVGIILAATMPGCHRGTNVRPRPIGGLREYMAQRPTYPPPPSQRLTLGSYAAYNYGPLPGTRVIPAEPEAPLFGP